MIRVVSTDSSQLFISINSWSIKNCGQICLLCKPNVAFNTLILVLGLHLITFGAALDKTVGEKQT